MCKVVHVFLVYPEGCKYTGILTAVVVGEAPQKEHLLDTDELHVENERGVRRDHRGIASLAVC